MDKIKINGCKYLRAKNAYGTMEGGDDPFLPLDEGTTNYWCLKTCGTVGPDNFFAYTDACTSKRICFTPFEDAIEEEKPQTILKSSDNLLT